MAPAATKNSKSDVVTETGDSVSSEVAVTNGFSSEELRGIQSLADVQALFAEHQIKVVNAAEEIGDGFTLVPTTEKGQFEGKEMIILSWVFGEGDVKKKDGSTAEFVAMRFVVSEQSGVGKYIITDGGVGIYKQLREYTDRTGATGGMHVKKGLRASRYSNEFTDDGVTFYLDLSK